MIGVFKLCLNENLNKIMLFNICCVIKSLLVYRFPLQLLVPLQSRYWRNKVTFPALKCFLDSLYTGTPLEPAFLTNMQVTCMLAWGAMLSSMSPMLLHSHELASSSWVENIATQQFYIERELVGKGYLFIPVTLRRKRTTTKSPPPPPPHSYSKGGQA